MAISSADIRNVAIVGHKGAGKTSLITALVTVARAMPALKDPRATPFDDSPEEKERGMTLETRVASFEHNGRRVNLIDTPGEGNFAADAQLAMFAADAALLVVSARDGVETGTERVFRWLRERTMPCLVVLTKSDDPNAKPDEVLGEIKKRLGSARLTVMEVPMGIGAEFEGVVAVRTGKAFPAPDAPGVASKDMPGNLKDAVQSARSQLADDVACTDDALTEKFLNDGDLSAEDLEVGMRAAIATGTLVPLYYVATPKPAGVTALLEAICDLVPPPTSRAPWKGSKSADGAADASQAEERPPSVDAPFAAFVFKTHIDQHAGRISYARILSGSLKSDGNTFNSTRNSREQFANIAQGVGKEMKPVQQAIAGDIVAFGKLKATKTNETLSDEGKPFVLEKPPLSPPLFSRSLVVERGLEDKLATALGRQVEEDPGLSLAHDEHTRELLLSGLGVLHLEITLERIKRRAGVEAKLGPPRIAYRETITKKAAYVEGKQKKQTGGHGQFGVCYIDLEPMPRGSGFEFEDAIVGGVIPRQFIPSVEKGIVKGMTRGVLSGHPVVDVKVRLVDGKTHAVDSSDAAFQVAGFRAFQAAYKQCNPVILEPYAKVSVSIPSEVLGDVIGDLNSRRGKVTGTDQVGDMAIINAFVPLSEMLEYEPRLGAMTRGRGTFTLSYDHYEPCPPMVQDKLIKDSGYKPPAEED